MLAGYYKKDDIGVLFLALNNMLERKGFQNVDVFVYGSAGLVIDGVVSRHAQDIDVHIPDHFAAEKIRGYIPEIAGGFGLDSYPKDWLEVNRFIPTIMVMAAMPADYFEQPKAVGSALRVRTLKPEYQLMCKLVRQAKGNDFTDMATLCTHLNITTKKELIDFVERRRHVLDDDEQDLIDCGILNRRWLEISVTNSAHRRTNIPKVA